MGPGFESLMAHGNPHLPGGDFFFSQVTYPWTPHTYSKAASLCLLIESVLLAQRLTSTAKPKTRVSRYCPEAHCHRFTSANTSYFKTEERSRRLRNRANHYRNGVVAVRPDAEDYSRPAPVWTIRT